MEHQSASIIDRMAATLIDIIILVIATALAVIVTVSIPVINEIWLGSDTHKLWIAKSFTPLLFLFINGYKLAKTGQTLGKQAMNIQIVSNNGHLCDNIQYFYRYILLMILLLLPDPIMLGLLLLLAIVLLYNKNKSIHDFVAKTRVIQLPD